MKFGDRFYYLWWHWGWFWIGFNHTFLFVPFSFLHFAFVSHPFFFMSLYVPVVFLYCPWIVICLVHANPVWLSFSCFFLGIYLSCNWNFIFLLHLKFIFLSDSCPCPSFFFLSLSCHFTCRYPFSSLHFPWVFLELVPKENNCTLLGVSRGFKNGSA